jgi:Lsr2
MGRMVRLATGENWLVDDIDQSMAAEIITYALDGTIYAIDLSEDNADQLRSLLQHYIQASRIVGHYTNEDLNAQALNYPPIEPKHPDATNAGDQ